MNPLFAVALRQQAVYVPEAAPPAAAPLAETTGVLVANLVKLGFGVSEPLLQALNAATPSFQLGVLEAIREVLGVNKNWTPLVKGWDVPTGESVTDHLVTFFVNLVGGRGTELPCGHTIPPGTFPLERYNGCPFCGRPFVVGELELDAQGSTLKLLSLWGEPEVIEHFRSLLLSKTALDATQVASLTQLVTALPLPAVEIPMKETRLVVIDALVNRGEPAQAQALFETPTDILRYLWFKQTGLMQVAEPRTILARAAKNVRHVADEVGNITMPATGRWRQLLAALQQLGWFKPHDSQPPDAPPPAQAHRSQALQAQAAKLKLKYTRKQCWQVASWLNALPLATATACEMMHPKRRMWVRFIRALRLGEYSRRAGFEPLRKLLDAFYNGNYEVFSGKLERARLAKQAEETFALLKQRPGLFARSLFANMLWFGPEVALAEFHQVIDRVPARLVFTLNSLAENYFSPAGVRTVKPLGGVAKSVPKHRLLALYEPARLAAMKSQLEDLCLTTVRKRFAAIPNSNRTIFIDPLLFKLPVAIGDRSESVQDLPATLMGTRFPVAGDAVRLFMQWGAGMQAQHLDMDLSCHLASANRQEICSFCQLTATGCKHSGDIREIPDQVGTAEYVEINLPELERAKVDYLVFTCNAYSRGSITPNLVIGWMNSGHPMKVSETTGVAYDPSCVQHQVRITRGAAKGLVFGVLEVATREIIWLEMAFAGQVVQNLNTATVQGLLAKLNSKLSVGNLLMLKAEAQQLSCLETPTADENYTAEWARDSAAVTALLVD
jgi:hypothetical protein